MTSYAMISCKYGRTETPPTFTRKYYYFDEDNDNYRDPCNQTADYAAETMGQSVTAANTNPTRAEIENIIEIAIDNGRPVIVRTDQWGSHYVVAYGYYSTGTGSITIYIRDPEGDYDATTLGEIYRAGNVVRSYAVIG